MPIYYPIDMPFGFDATKSDLIKVDWSTNHLSADFLMPDDDAHCVRVRFEVSTIVRLLDEMPLSTESDPKDVEGLVPHHFAYRVEGAAFSETQSSVWKEVIGSVAHYEFVTGWGCMDVLAPAEPQFEIIPTDMIALARYNARWEQLHREEF